jgi:pyruvate dehydrogenase E1 component alpha subunit
MPATDPFAMLRAMMVIRAFETALAARADHGFQLLSTGEEAVAVGLCSAFAPEDVLLTGGRSIGPALARGVQPGALMAELLGRSAGTNRGKGGRGHISDPASGFFGAHAVVAGNISIAAGVALSRRLTGEAGIVAVLFGDGACGAGILHETLNIAALWALPVLFVCGNNQLSVSTPRAAALAAGQLSDLAVAHGIAARTVDGMDVAAVAEAAAMGAAHVRAGRGPYFLECLAHRFVSHSTSARETRTPEALAAIRALCPIAALEAQLRAGGVLDEAAESDLAAHAERVVTDAIVFAEASPWPQAAEAMTDVW